MKGAATFAPHEAHQRLIDAALVYLATVAAVVDVSAPGVSDPVRQQATTAAQGLLIGMGQQHPDTVGEITFGVGAGLGLTFATSSGGEQGAVDACTQMLADGLGFGLVAGSAALNPANREPI